MSDEAEHDTTGAPPAGTPVERGATLFLRIGGTSIKEELWYMQATRQDPETYATETLAYLEAVESLGWHFTDQDVADLAAYMRFAQENPPIEYPVSPFSSHGRGKTNA